MIINAYRCNPSVATQAEDRIAALMVKRVKAEQCNLGLTPGAKPLVKQDGFPCGGAPAYRAALRADILRVLDAVPISATALALNLRRQRDALRDELRRMCAEGLAVSLGGKGGQRWALADRRKHNGGKA